MCMITDLGKCSVSLAFSFKLARYWQINFYYRTHTVSLLRCAATGKPYETIFPIVVQFEI